MPPPPSQRGLPPRLGPYRIEGELGRGGMGVVYRGRHLELGIERALKVLDRLEPKALARFEREASHLARVNHPNVIQIHEVGVEDGRPWLAMALADGRPLNDLLEERRPSLSEALALAEGIAKGVAALHEAGVVHRDLKPANVVVGADQRPLVLDLGLAVAPGLDQRLTRTGTTLGTVSYMAPEQFHGAETSTPATDVHALGLILFELVTGQPAIAHGSAQEVAAAILTEDRPRPTSLDPDLPAALDPLCRRATHRDPTRRPPDAAAFAAELGALAADPGPSRRSIRRRWLVTGALGLLLAAGLTAVVTRGSPAEGSPDPGVTPVATSPSPTATPSPVPTTGPRTPGKPWRTLRHPRCRGAAFLDDGRLVTWGEDRSVRLWDVAGERVLQRWSAPHIVTAGAASTDGTIAFADQEGVYMTRPDQGGARTLYELDRRLLPRSLAFSPGGTQLAVAGRRDASVLILDRRGRLLRKIGTHRAKIDQVAFSPDGARLATACGESMDTQLNQVRDHAVRLFDASSGAELKRFPFVGQANAVEFHPQGQRLAVCADGQAVVLIDLVSGARTQLEGRGAGKGSLLIAAHAGVSRAVAFTRDGRYVLSVSDGTLPAQNELRVWDAETGRELVTLRRLRIKDSSIGSLVVSPAGRDVALSHGTGVWLFDVEGLLSLRTSPADRR